MKPCRPLSLPLLVLAALVLAGCLSAPGPASLPAGEIPVAPELADFWQAHGGLATFGPPLAPARHENSLVIQTFLNVELVYDPSSGLVRLAPLGYRLGLAEPPVPPPTDGQTYFPATGHTLHPGFARAYEDLGGQQVLGAPIAEVAFREDRVLQYFENAGLYRDLDAPPSEVRLLAFGLAYRAARPPEVARDLRAVLPPDVRSRPFGLFLDQHGGERIFGRPLTEPYLAPDGAVEQVYEGAVLYSPAEAPGEVRLRPLGRSLGPPAPPAEPAPEPEAIYFPETGHNVRWAFAEFYRAHDGQRLFGLPLEEAHPEGETLRQRFENVVLLYRYDLPPHLAILLAPIGRAYRPPVSPQATALPAPPTPTPPAAPTPLPLAQVETWVAHSVLPPGRTQEVFVRLRLPDGRPWTGVRPVVALQTRQGVTYIEGPPTDAQGISRTLVVLQNLVPGEIVTYEVAVASETGLGYALGQFAAGVPSP